MSLWRQLTRGARALTHRAAQRQDTDDELQHWLDQSAAAHRRDGLSTGEARLAARREVGNQTVAREQVRDYGWENMVETVAGDLRYAARRLRGNPGFTSVAVLTLALGIGSSTAIFSAVSPILFEPLPYPHAERVLSLRDVGAAGGTIDVTFGTYRELLARARSFEAMAVMRPCTATLIGGAQPERLAGQCVSEGYFRTLGVAPLLGRDFDASEDVVRGPAVVMMSEGLWRRAFGGDPSIIGRSVTFGERPYTVIGIVPASFENVLAPSAELWSPLQYDQALPPNGREWGHHLRMIARLRPGVDVATASRELGAIARTRVPEFARAPWAAMKDPLVASRLQDDLTRGVRPALLAVLGAVLLVLAIACVNVTNLLLARGAQRRGEIAMRAALGAGRGRLVRQLLTESVLLAVVGGALGLIVARLGVGALLALSPPELPRVSAIGLHAGVFAFAASTTLFIGVVIGLVPALHVSRRDLYGDAQRSTRRTAGGHRATRAVLVVAEVALALVLLVSAGLLLRSLERLFAVTPGFVPTRGLTMQVQLAGHRYENDGATLQFYEQALDAVRHVPGVTSAAFTSQLPLSGDFDKYGVRAETAPPVNPDDDWSAFRYAVSPGYIETTGISLVRGRPLAQVDGASAPRSALVSESLVKHRLAAGIDPIGQRIHIGGDEEPWYTVVGVVGDVKQTSLAMGAADAVYIAPAQWRWVDRAMWIIVRARGDAASLAPAIKRAIWSVDKDQAIVRVSTLDALVAASAAERRFALTLFEAFALAALALAATGIFGVLSGSVTERLREIGVRAALGATRADILGLVVRQGMALTALGVVIGVLGSLAAGRALSALLFGISSNDPLTYIGVVLLLGAVAAIACGVPAWRAARVDPTITLRAEG